MIYKKIATNVWLLRNCRNFSTFNAMKSLNRKIQTKNGLATLSMRGCPRPLLYRPNTSDIGVAWEVFYGKEYSIPMKWPFRTVADCGANIGLFLGFALGCVESGQLHYVGVEPDEQAFRILQQQVESLELHNKYRLLNAAVWNHNGVVNFDDSGPSWGHHVSSTGTCPVQALTIQSILDAGDIDQCDLLKLDIEGGEKYVLDAIAQWGCRVKTIVAELHDGLTFEWFSDIVRNAGYIALPPGSLFRSHPSAVRRDYAGQLGITEPKV